MRTTIALLLAGLCALAIATPVQVKDGVQYRVNIYEKDGFDLLGKVIESNPDSPNNRFYGYLQVIAHQVLGYSAHPVHQYKVQPSVLEHFETALRDPIFYQFYKRITYYFLKYKSHLPHYTYKQLNYPGVTIDSVNVDKLVTFFDKFEFDITNALYVNEEEYVKDDFQVWARQYRLNYKPFTYKINVNSDKNTDVVFRVFLGPKYDEQGHEIPLNENRINFVEFDKFVYTLKTGMNVVERNSREGETVKDRTTYRALYQHVMSALKGQEEFHLDMTEAHNGFPNRFILPMGKVSGQVYQFYVYVSPYQTSHEKPTFDKIISAGVGSGTRYVDDLPFGYPFDRQIKYEHTFFVPNSHFEDVVIFHKPQVDLKYPVEQH
ncbi:Larval serum protein 1 alpha [Carabus blaptoides fortunei]